jgi:hypothetical protein
MSDLLETYPYEGRARKVLGRLHYPEPPEPGTIVGPNAWGEKCVVLGTVVEGDRPTTLIGLAITDDITRATDRIQGLNGQVASGPRSLQERRANRVQW